MSAEKDNVNALLFGQVHTNTRTYVTYVCMVLKPTKYQYMYMIYFYTYIYIFI